jgi:polyhydroxybutyrate depolymerase
MHNGTTRTYVVRAPRGLTRSSAPIPVVLVLHGGGGSAANAERMTGFTALVERERVLVVYPDGSSRAGPLHTWNAVHCCAYAMERNVDDVGFVNALLDQLAAEYPVDPKRVFATGMSNGAMMSHRLARELPHRIAAIAPVVGALFGDEPPARGPVPMLAFNGALDSLIPPAGGGEGRGGRGFDGMRTTPVEEQGTYWARANGCGSTPQVSERGVLRHLRWPCPPGRSVELYLVADNGHAWPGGQRGSTRADGPSRAINATEAMWAFFRAHPKP